MDRIQELLHKFHEIADTPKEQLQKYLLQNKKVIACGPIYTPEEIIHSMGMIPFGTWGQDIQIKEAKAYFPAFICSVMQSILELGIKGTYEGVSAIVIPSLCDSLKCLGENWKYAVPKIEFIPMVYPQNRNSSYGKEFTKASYQRVILDLERITGETFSDEKLKQSIDIYNEHNKVMRQFSDCIDEYPLIKASHRNAIFKSGYFMEKSEHTKLVRQLLEELKKEKEEVIEQNKHITGKQTHKSEYQIADTIIEQTTEKNIRVVTSGILADAKELLKIFDDNNIRIVADDIAHESRQYRVDCENADTGLDSLAEKFANMNNCSVLYDNQKGRANYITDLVSKRKADGVIMLMTKFCDPEEFDYVIIKKVCEEKKIPLLLIEIDRQMVNYEQVRTAVQTFSEMLS